MPLDTAALTAHRLDLLEQLANLADAPVRPHLDEPAEQLIKPILHADRFRACSE
jgi:hypothetical protein